MSTLAEEISSDHVNHFSPSEMSESSKQLMETLQCCLASEIASCLGIAIHAATAKIVEAIQNAETPARANMEELERMINATMKRELTT